MPWNAALPIFLVGAAAVSLMLIGAAFYRRWRGFSRRAITASIEGSSDTAKVLMDLPVLVVDLETTGLDVRKDRVVSVGAVAVRGACLDRDNIIDILVNPDQPIPPLSTAIHGITDAMVTDALSFTEAIEYLNAMLTDRVIVGHNIGYDMAILRGECARLDLKWPQPIALDLVRLAAALDPRERDLTLEGMAARLGVPVSGRHTALGDALMTAEMWVRVLPRLHASGVVTVGDALALERRARSVIANQKRAGW